MKIAYIGIDLFCPALEILLQNGCTLMELFTCKTDDITEFHHEVAAIAGACGAPVHTDRITTHDLERLKKNGCEAVFCAGYYYKIPLVSDLPMLNIHPSLLPYGRGAWPMPYDILEERKTSGVTIHKIADGFDTGDIVLQRSFALSEKETLVSFMEKVYVTLPEMLAALLDDFDTLYQNATPQADGVYLPMPEKSMYTLSYDSAYAHAEKTLRAFLGYDCYYATADAEYRLIGAKAVKSIPKDTDILALPIRDGYIVCPKNGVQIM